MLSPKTPTSKDMNLNKKEKKKKRPHRVVNIKVIQKVVLKTLQRNTTKRPGNLIETKRLKKLNPEKKDIQKKTNIEINPHNNLTKCQIIAILNTFKKLILTPILFQYQTPKYHLPWMNPSTNHYP
jgi:hypothetical protein